jgi:uroporphyrinogen-III synthase
MRRVVVTRALPEAEITAARIRELGHEAVVAPLLSIAALPFDADTSGAQALIFTSINGVRAFAAQSQARGLAAFTVGDATAAAAREAGFTRIHSADGAAGDLLGLVKALAAPDARALIHFSGAHIARDIAADLAAAGFRAERRIAYEARAATALPAALIAPFDLILFHSARAAETFVELGGQGGGRTAACISEAVAAAARGAGFKRIIVAPAPREDALLAAAFGG